MDVCIINKMRLSIVTRNQKMCWKIIEQNLNETLKTCRSCLMEKNNKQCSCVDGPQTGEFEFQLQLKNLAMEWKLNANAFPEEMISKLHIRSQGRVKAIIDWKMTGEGVERLHKWIHWQKNQQWNSYNFFFLKVEVHRVHPHSDKKK